MLPRYLDLDKSVSLIREKSGFPITADWLLQLAHEEKIELLVLVREPVYFMAQRAIPINWTEIFAQVMGQKPKNNSLLLTNPGYLNSNAAVSRRVLALARSNDLPDLPPKIKEISNALFSKQCSSSNNSSNLASSILAAMEARPVITLENRSFQEECFSIADYVPLEPVCAGRIFASKDNPRFTDIEEMFVKGKKTHVFTKSNKGGWRITEEDIFVETNKLDRFLEIFTDKSSRTDNDVLKKNEELTEILKRIQENQDGPVPLTKQQMLAKPWPLHTMNLDKIFSDPPKWAKLACVFRNSPGSGSSLWNPALFAYCLATTSSFKRRPVKKEVLDNFIKKRFPDWISQWEDLANFI